MMLYLKDEPSLLNTFLNKMSHSNFACRKATQQFCATDEDHFKQKSH